MPWAAASYARSLSVTAAIALGVAILGLRPADAILIRDSAGSATARSLGTPWDGVVELETASDPCTGSLISSRHVLTAEHCTAASPTNQLQVNFHTSNDGSADFSVPVASKAALKPTDQLFDGTDISVLGLSSAVGGIQPLPLATGVREGSEVTMVGFGNNGLGTQGTNGTRDGRRWAAENVMDRFGPAVAGPSNLSNILNTDFDNGTAAKNSIGSKTPLANEGTTAAGDSGGPLLHNGRILGVLTAGLVRTEITGTGDVSWWTGTFNSSPRNFIETETDGRVTFAARSIPLPSSLVLLFTGLVSLYLTSTVNRRKRTTPER